MSRLSSAAQEEIDALRQEGRHFIVLETGDAIVQNSEGEVIFVGDTELTKTLVSCENTLKCIDAYKKGGALDVFELVRREGLEKEHCLIYGGMIFFHSPSKEACDAYAKNSGLKFTRCVPSLQ